MRYGWKRNTIPTLRMALEQSVVPELKAFIFVLTKKNGVGRKDSLIEEILRLMDGDNLHDIWSLLDKLQKLAVSETAHSDESRFDRTRFKAKYGKLPAWEHVYSWKPNPNRMNLFFFSDIMPEDLKMRLRAFVPAPEASRLATTDEVPKALERRSEQWHSGTGKTAQHVESIDITILETEPCALHDLPAVLGLVEAGKLPVSDKTRHPTAAGVRAVSGVLLGGDYYDNIELDRGQEGPGSIKPFAWPMIVQAAGLAELAGKRLQLSRAGQRVINAAPETILRKAWNRWLKTRMLDEFRRIDNIKGQTGKGKSGFTALADRRAVINQALSECPVGEWVSVDELFRYMQAGDMGFEIHRNLVNLYIADAHYGHLNYSGFAAWSMLQGRYILCLLFEYAATMGLIDVAYTPPHDVRDDYHKNWGVDELEFFSRYDGLLYIRLTGLGAYCLKLTEKYVPSTPKPQNQLQALPNLDLVATGSTLPPGDVLFLDTYTERVSDAVWRLDLAKMLVAAEGGHDLGRFSEWLTARCATELPQPVSRFLADVAERTGALRSLGMARRIECSDSALATLIANDTHTGKLCSLVGQRGLVVPLELETRFRTAIRKLGFILPK